jgi:PadR family transcriptional regulator PadR
MKNIFAYFFRLYTMQYIVLRSDEMNVQIKKGIVEVCVLASLRREPSYGYKIINDISELIEISESTLYPILRRLEAQDMLRTFSKDFNGRVRKYYEITRLGEKRIRDFTDEWKDMERVYDFIRRRDR